MGTEKNLIYQLKIFKTSYFKICKIENRTRNVNNGRSYMKHFLNSYLGLNDMKDNVDCESLRKNTSNNHVMAMFF